MSFSLPPTWTILKCFLYTCWSRKLDHAVVVSYRIISALLGSSPKIWKSRICYLYIAVYKYMGLWRCAAHTSMHTKLGVSSKSLDNPSSFISRTKCSLSVMHTMFVHCSQHLLPQLYQYLCYLFKCILCTYLGRWVHHTTVLFLYESFSNALVQGVR